MEWISYSVRDYVWSTRLTYVRWCRAIVEVLVVVLRVQRIVERVAVVVVVEWRDYRVRHVRHMAATVARLPPFAAVVENLMRG